VGDDGRLLGFASDPLGDQDGSLWQFLDLVTHGVGKRVENDAKIRI